MEVKIGIQQFLRWALVILAFVPLIVTNNTLFPFIFGKTTLIRFSVTLFFILLAVFLFRYRMEKGQKVLKTGFVRNPIFLLVAIYLFLMLFSTIFATSPYRAFFGDIERGEGYIGMLYFFGFLVATLMVFRKEDWLAFFKISLIVGAILFFDTLSDFSKGIERTSGSSVGNPVFLACYFLFSIFSSSVVLALSRGKGWRYASYIVALLSALGIFMTKTRGTLLGLFAGILMVVIYLAFKAGDTHIKLRDVSINIKKTSIVFLIIFTLGTFGFIATRDLPVWQKIPGLDRLATISLNDSTTQTRLISAGVSLHAIDPKNNGIAKFLIGWGPEQFRIAYNQNYNPEFFRFETTWFDRAHDKIFDVLVMNGVLGLIAYLGVWLSILYVVFRKSGVFNDSLKGIGQRAHIINGSIVFFSAAYFIQNLFVFDQITTYIPFFSLLGFTIFVKPVHIKKLSIKIGEKASEYAKYAVLIVAGCLTFAFIAYSIVPYRQMSKFIGALKQGNAQALSENMDSMTKPYNFAQAEIRYRILSAVSSAVNNPAVTEIFNKSTGLLEEVIVHEPYEPRHYMLLGSIANARANNANSTELYKQSEEYFRKASELVPRRQDIIFFIAVDLVGQGRIDEAKAIAEEMLSYETESPFSRGFYAMLIGPLGGRDGDLAIQMLRSVFENVNIPNQSSFSTIRNVYSTYLGYYFRVKDDEGFLRTLEQAKKLEQVIAETGMEKPSIGQGGITQQNMLLRIESEIRAFKARGWDAVQ